MSVAIGGSIISGIDDSTGSNTDSGGLYASDDIGSISIKGSLVGNDGAGGITPVLIVARGQAAPTATSDIAIGSLTIGGRVERAYVFAGYDPNLNALNGDAQIGKVSVGGDWIASNLVAGVRNIPAGNAQFGDANDTSIGAGAAGISAKIASILIKGTVFGAAGVNHFGFSAQEIGSFKAGGFKAVLTPAKNVIELAPLTADVTIREV